MALRPVPQSRTRSERAMAAMGTTHAHRRGRRAPAYRPIAPIATRFGGCGRSREKAPRKTSRTAVTAVVIRTSRSTRRHLRRGGEDVPRLGKSKARPSPSPVGEKRSVRQVSWLPDLSPSGSFPDARPLRSHASSGFSPGASPVTVAGAARDLHPLPSTERNQRTSGDDTPLLFQCHPERRSPIPCVIPRSGATRDRSKRADPRCARNDR